MSTTTVAIADDVKKHTADCARHELPTWKNDQHVITVTESAYFLFRTDTELKSSRQIQLRTFDYVLWRKNELDSTNLLQIDNVFFVLLFTKTTTHQANWMTLSIDKIYDGKQRINMIYRYKNTSSWHRFGGISNHFIQFDEISSGQKTIQRRKTMNFMGLFCIRSRARLFMDHKMNLWPFPTDDLLLLVFF